jgi:hypothetical protein
LWLVGLMCKRKHHVDASHIAHNGKARTTW